MKALILIGGFGTRLRPLSCTRPKVLFPIVNKPLLQWTFERLAANGVDEVILAANELTEFYIKQQRIPNCGLIVKYSHDPPKKPLGTAGPVKRAENLLGHAEPFVVLNGDIFADISYREMLENHVEGRAIATIALHEVEDPSRYGVVELADRNRVKRFIEKPLREEAPTNLINAGVYVLSPKVFDYIPAGRAVSMEREIFPKLAEDNTLYGHKVNGLWIDIGKPDEYLQTNKILLENFSNKLVNQKKGKFVLKNPVALDKDVSIGENSIIGPYTVLGRGVIVGKNVKIKETIIFPGAKIGDFATLNGALIGECAQIGEKVKISPGCIIADQAKVKDNISLQKKIAVCPAKDVTEDTLKSKSNLIC